MELQLTVSVTLRDVTDYKMATLENQEISINFPAQISVAIVSQLGRSAECLAASMLATALRQEQQADE